MAIGPKAEEDLKEMQRKLIIASYAHSYIASYI